MATEIWPDEGLNLVLAIFPKAGTNPSTTYIGLFNSGSSSAISASQVGTSGQTRSSYVETTSGAYGRQAIAAASWGSTASYAGGGRQVTAGQVTFPTATTSGWGTIWGFFIGDTSTTAAGTLYFAANFDDTTAVTINSSDVIKVTPTIAYGS